MICKEIKTEESHIQRSIPAVASYSVCDFEQLQLQSTGIIVNFVLLMNESKYL